MTNKSSDIHLFTDGSFDPVSSHGVIGWEVRSPSLALSEVGIESGEMSVKEKNCTRVELLAFKMGLDRIAKLGLSQKIIHAFTDSQTICNLPSRAARLYRQNFVSKRSGLALTNADLYKEILNILSALNLSINWLPGHSRKQGRSLEQEVFSQLDQRVRKRLRQETNRSKDHPGS